jgi:dTDP-4-amino-4,6-dideoxygalactose transaminase
MSEAVQVPVAFLDLQAERAALGDALQTAVARVLESGRYILGPEVEGFERDFAAYQNARHGIGLASGTDAVILALLACGVGPGDGVITSAYTFFASAAAIAWIGARPILVDVEASSGLIDLRRVAEVLASPPAPVRCILPFHLYGRLVDMNALAKLARGAGAKIVEDAAQAHGAERGGRRAGELGDATCFSFYPTKNLGCAGDGGMVTSSDDQVAERMRRLRDHGCARKYEHLELGTNSRLSAIQAAILSVKLPHLEGWNDARRRSAALYDRAFAGASGVTPLLDPPDSRSAYHQYVVRITDGRRDEILATLTDQGIGAAVHYPSPVHLQPAAREWGWEAGSLPVAESLAREVLCLPIHPFLKPEEVERVAGAVLGGLRE